MAEVESNQSETWNTGGAYSFNKIFKNLDLFDSLIEVARWGAESMDTSMGLPPLVLNRARIEAMNRMVGILRKIFDNSAFKIKAKDKTKFNDLEGKLDEVEKFIDGISSIKFDQIRDAQSIEIKKEHFNESFKAMREIARELNTYVDKAGFIFRTNEDITVDSVKERFVNQG